MPTDIASFNFLFRLIYGTWTKKEIDYVYSRYLPAKEGLERAKAGIRTDGPTDEWRRLAKKSYAVWERWHHHVVWHETHTNNGRILDLRPSPSVLQRLLPF